jgi:hypothetical protein
MSFVTGIMLIIGPGDFDEQSIAEVQAWLSERKWPQLVDVSDASGGNKHPQFECWSAGINYFDETGFTAFVMSRDWLAPENMVLIIQPEEGSARVYRCDGYSLSSNDAALAEG